MAEVRREVGGRRKEVEVMPGSGDEGALRSWLASRFQILNSQAQANSALLVKVNTTMEQRRNVDEEAAKKSILIDTLKGQISSLQSALEDHKNSYGSLVYRQKCLELENEDLRRKLVSALLLGKVEERSVVHFLERNPRAPELTEGIIATQVKLSELSKQKKKKNGTPPITTAITTPLVLQKKIEMLEDHLESLNAKHSLEILNFKEREKIGVEERKSLRAHYTKRLAAISQKLDETERLLEKAVEENVEMERVMVEGEKKWAEEEERLVTLLHEHGLDDFSSFQLETRSQSMKKGANSKKAIIMSERRLRQQLARTEVDLLTATNTIKEYELKFMRMEDQVEKLRDQLTSTHSHYSAELEKVRKNKETLECRNNREETHRRLEAQGFRADLKDLKEKLNALRINFERFEMGVLMKPDQLEPEEKETRSAVFNLFVGASVEAARRVQKLESQLVPSRKGSASSKGGGTTTTGTSSSGGNS